MNKPRMMLVLLLMSGQLTACTRDRAQRDGSEEGGATPAPGVAVPAPDTPAVRPNGDEADTSWTGEKIEQETQPDPGIGPPMLVAARAAAHDQFDRIVFEFDGPLPGYKVEYLDPPVTQCGSGDVVELPGDAWLSVRLFPANAHTEAGKPSIAARDQAFSGINLKRLKLICDFEAVVEWIAAVGTPKQFRVLELKAPDRLVIDIGKSE
jgi:hypothetical protein